MRRDPGSPSVLNVLSGRTLRQRGAEDVAAQPLESGTVARLRHPLAGLTVAYAAVSGGFGANLVVTALDPMLAGLTEAAARLVDPAAHVPATCNWWFNAASVVLLTAVGTIVAERARCCCRRASSWRFAFH